MRGKIKSLLTRDLLYCMIIVMASISIIYLITRGGYIYGSTTDWGIQHFSLPEYFRTRFYATGQLIPSFAPNLGGGQNIYNVSYYGVLSPVILFSYLLPFIKMRTYIIYSTIILILVSDILCYIWMKKRYSKELSFAIAFLYSMAAPLLYHSHRHIMFVNYMPFVILAFMGVDRYFETKKRGLLIINSFLIILTSYFFSVGALLSIFIYGLYVYLEKNETIKVKAFLKDMCQFAYNFIISVLMSCVLLLPTFYVLLSGRAETSKGVNVKDLFIPNFNLYYDLYDDTSLGLTAIFIMAVIYLIYSRKKQNVMLGIMFIATTFISLFAYILNGTMYINQKVFIPFIPLGVLAIANFLNDLPKEKKNKNFTLLLIIESVLGAVCVLYVKYSINFNNVYKSMFVKDMALCMVLLVVYYFIRRKEIIIVPTLIVSFCVSYHASSLDQLEKKERFSDDIDNQLKQAADYISSNEKDSIYRTYLYVDDQMNVDKILNNDDWTTSIYSSVLNRGYNDFHFKEFGVENIDRCYTSLAWGKNSLFNNLMGTKYFIADKCDLQGYEEIKRISDEVAVYENKDVLPIGLATSNLMSKKDYKKLKYPYNAEALMRNVIVDSNVDSTEYKSDLVDFSDKFNVKQKADSIKTDKISDDKVRMKVSANNSLVKLTPKESIKDKILIFKYDVDNTISDPEYPYEGDVGAYVDTIYNVLSRPGWRYYNYNEQFQFVLGNKKYEDIDIQFSAGAYDVSNRGIYTYDYKKLANIRQNVDEFFIKETKGDLIKGDIDVSNDGYFRLTIPYDKGFEIKVDGKKVNYEKVNNTFIGFPIEKGKHNIDINFTAPLLIPGKILSLIGILLFTLYILNDKGVLNKLKVKIKK